MNLDGLGCWIRLSDWLMRSFPWLRPFATDLWGGLTDLQIQGLCISLLTGPFKKILRCYWPTFSTDSQLGAFVSTALWLMSRECLLFRRSNFTSDFNRRCLETFSTLFSLRSRQTIWNLYNVCVPSLRRRSMFHGRVLLTSYWARLTRQAEAWR